MTRIFEHSAHPDGPLPSLDTLRALHRRATAQGIEWIVVGALARDIVIHRELHQNPARATDDVDIAVSLAIGEPYSAFTRDWPTARGAEHKFLVEGSEVDVVPFGAHDQDSVLFSDGHRLDVIGLREAVEHPDLAVLGEGLIIPVASLESLAPLKILAWRDRHTSGPPRDAVDLRTILAASSEGRYADEAWDDEQALLACDYDILTAGPFRLGHIGGARFTHQRGATVLDVLTDEESRVALVRDMGGFLAEDLLGAFLRGFRAGLASVTP